MQSHFHNSGFLSGDCGQENHLRRQAAALLGDQPEARQTFVAGLLEDGPLIEHARRTYLSLLHQQGWTGALYAAAAEDSLSTILRTPFRRTEALLAWQPARGQLATWWAQQALFEFNNDGRRFAERTQGLRRGSDERLYFVTDTEDDESGLSWASTLVDEGADPAQRHERAADDAALRTALTQGGQTEQLALLQGWLAADALHADEPVCLKTGQVRLRWRYGAQQALAARQGVTARTLRNRARAVETWLTSLSGRDPS